MQHHKCIPGYETSLAEIPIHSFIKPFFVDGSLIRTGFSEVSAGPLSS